MVTSILAAVPTEAPASLPMPPAVFGLAAVGVFLLLLVGTLAFRNAGHRH
jgi:hypothetical protein